MKKYGWLLISCALGLPPAVSLSQAAAPLVHTTFEDEDGGWVPIGATAKAALTHDPTHLKAGKGAMQFDYAVKKGEINALALPVAPGVIAGAGSIHFWVHSDYPTSMALVLQERGGGRYVSIFSAPGDKWQEVAVSPSDMILAEEPNDPQDPDGKLDLDQVESVSMADLDQLFMQAEGTPLTALFSVRPGQHTLYLHDFTVSPEPPAGGSPQVGSSIDTFDRPQLSWIGVGDVGVVRSTGKPLSAGGLQANYRQSTGKVIGLVRAVTPKAFAGKSALVLTAASDQKATLVVQVEERDGGKYNTTIDVPGGKESKEFRLAFADFKPANDSHDANDKLDLDQIKQLIIIDSAGLVGTPDQDNTLWIGPVSTSATK